MSVLPVLAFPDPRLKQKSQPIDKVDDAIRQLMDDMFETMIAHEGCGLAAPQVGIHKRVVVIDFSYKDPNFKPLLMANPEIIWESDDVSNTEEACLSVPGQSSYVKRPSKVTVRYLDYDGNNQELEASEILATCIQHEIDHLDGLLFLDRVSSLKRKMLVAKINKNNR